MANYTGMKSILTKFWEKELAKNTTLFAPKSVETEITTLKGAVTTEGSILKSIKDNAKDATYSETQTIAQAIAAVSDEVAAKTAFKYEKVETLPTASADTMQKIYLVAKGEGKTGYKEWLTIDKGKGEYAWEEIGDTDISFDGYITTNDVVNAPYSENVTIGGAIDDVETRVSALESAEFGLTVNGVDAAVTKGAAGTTASVTINASNIKMSDAENAQTISEAITAAGQINDVKVKLTEDGEASTVVIDKVATIDLSPYAKVTDLVLSDEDFNYIFEENV